MHFEVAEIAHMYRCKERDGSGNCAIASDFGLIPSSFDSAASLYSVRNFNRAGEQTTCVEITSSLGPGIINIRTSRSQGNPDTQREAQRTGYIK